MNLKLQDVSRTVGERETWPSLFAQYISEREGKYVLETTDGFAVYELREKFVYIQDIFVVSEARKRGVAASMADQICEMAKAQGIKLLVGTVDPKAKGATESAKTLLAYGMKLDGIEGQLIYFSKVL